MRPSVVNLLLPEIENQQINPAIYPKSAKFGRSGTVWPADEIEPFNSPLFGPIIDGWQLRVCVIAGEFSFNGGDMQIIELGWVVVARMT